MKQTSSESILASLRILYRQENQARRQLITQYANNFKDRKVFLREEADFLSKRLLAHKIEADRSLPVKLLTVELVPSSCWFSNVRSHVSKPNWDYLRKSVYKKANYLCESCGGRGRNWPVECHEIWHYDEQQKIQTLKGLTALCPRCHQVKHIGLARIQGYESQAISHLCFVNDWSNVQAKIYLDKIWHTWQMRSCLDWKLDLTWIERSD